VTDSASPKRIATLVDHTHTAYSIAFSPDGRTIGYGCEDDKVNVWNVANLAAPVKISTLTEPRARIEDLAFSWDGRTLAATANHVQNDIHEVVLWNTAESIFLVHANTRTYRSYVYSVAFSPQRNDLAIVDGNDVNVWNATNLADLGHVARLSAPGKWVDVVIFFPDGHTLAGASNGSTVKRRGSVVLWTL
jgi:WD40 repeat protein